MKWTLFILIIFITSCAQVAYRNPSAKNPDKHIVFDIDWTIVAEIKKPTPSQLKNKRIIEVFGVHYYVNDGLEEFIEDLTLRKDVKISFFSGGNKLRNTELLSKIKLKDGRSLKDVAFKVLNNEDLVIVDNASQGARFSERFKKDLTKVSLDLDQLIMLDDTANFVLENSDNQNEHVFHIGSTFEYFENFSDTNGLRGEYVPQSYEQWMLDKKKLNILNIAFNEAYAEANETGISFSEAMKKRESLLDLKNHEWNTYSTSYYKKSQKNLALRSTVNVHDCYGLAKSLMEF